LRYALRSGRFGRTRAFRNSIHFGSAARLADDHQTANAKAYEALGCGVLLPQKELNAESLSSAALKIFFDEAGQAAMSAAAMKAAKPQAAEEAAKIIVETACLPDSPFAQIKN
jgi:UDP-N-acetylglucosamine:LPS N-acetylglucosamine transferase